jgi:hypothetical protein
VSVVAKVGSLSRGRHLLGQPVLFIVTVEHAPALGVLRGDQVPVGIVFVPAVPNPAARPGDQFETSEAPVRVALDLHTPPGAVDQDSQARSIVEQNDAVARSIPDGREPVALLVRRSALEIVEEPVLGVHEDGRFAVHAQRADVAQARHPTVRRQIVDGRLQERRRDLQGAPPHVNGPGERMAPSESKTDIALAGERGIGALEGEHEGPSQRHVCLRQGVDTASHDIDGIARVGLAVAAVLGVYPFTAYRATVTEQCRAAG